MLIKDEDRTFIGEYFPGLRFYPKARGEILKGTLSFTASYDKDKNKYYILNSFQETGRNKTISDEYEIEINLSDDVNPYREVKEIGGRISEVARLKKKRLIDLHAYGDKRVCVLGFLDENPEINLTDFIGSIIVPFFYDQSHYTRFDEWPRGEFSHSYLGMLENYYIKIEEIPTNSPEIIRDMTIRCIDSLKFISHLSHENKIGWEKLLRFLESGKMFRKKKGNKRGRCFCGSREHFPICHPEAFNGFVSLQKNLKELKLKDSLLK